ncbi:DUF1405 domain-containing protein [Halalkalibacterium ligniniphilum]|uniref:DUF1405 domain-containing protein n=1 Tax=Halalkalibacterium ligniniphilum TaxID=1134413 RepID=UPI00034CF24B|nr:DUF1405 domain-containing protein [Halalkalibacterium ligniniphilum]
MKGILSLFGNRLVIVILLLINFFGTIYGYIWYKDQLAITPGPFLLFVPDSPTASLFFVFVLIAFLLGKHWPLMEAFAAVTLIKYGVWAVAMIVAAAAAGDTLQWQHYMLIASHGGMALQALLYMPYYRIKMWHLMIVAVWTLHNDIIDYVFMMHPWVSYRLNPFIAHIGYFTFWLSIVSLALTYYFSVRRSSLKLEIVRR